MNVLSLFDGMSCGQIALTELGIIPDIYYASEIDKFAIAQTQLNFPDTIQLGSVTDVNVNELEPIDLLIGGSPCQSFSYAGKRNGMSTTTKEEVYTLDRYLQLKSEGFQFEGQSYLFWEYMRILTDIRKYNPGVIFLLENVEMSAKWEKVLSDAISLKGVHINSALVSAQKRKRIYWTNIRTKQVGFFGEIHSDIPHPEDRGIYLRDILEDEVDEKYYVSQKVLDRARRRNYSKPVINPDKAGTLNTKNNSGQVSLDSGTTFILTIPEATKKGYTEIRHGECFAITQPNSKSRRGRRMSDKCNCLMAGNMEYYRYEGPIASGSIRAFCGKHFRQAKDSSKSVTLIARARNDGDCLPAIVENNLRLRRLTPTECARLQTVPDWVIWNCSDTQKYKMLGNGWTIEVIKHIFKYLQK